MKPKNFPKRKYFRRVVAWQILSNRLKKYEKFTTAFWDEKKEKIKQIMDSLEKRTLYTSGKEQRDIRTKKARG